MELSVTHYSLGKTAPPGRSGWTLWKWSHNVVDRWVRDITVPASDGTSIDSSRTIHGLSDACCTQNCSWKAEISSSNLTGCLLHSLGVSECTCYQAATVKTSKAKSLDLPNIARLMASNTAYVVSGWLLKKNNIVQQFSVSRNGSSNKHS